MFRRNFLRVAQILPRSLARSTAAPALQAAWVLRLWPEVAKTVFGQTPGLQKVKAVTLKNNILTIKAPNSLWATELRLKSGTIIKEFNRKLGKALVFKLRFKLANDPG